MQADSWLSILNTIDYTVKHQSTILKYHGKWHELCVCLLAFKGNKATAMS